MIEEIAWAAGLFCGEGSTWIDSRLGNFHLGIGMLDHAAIEQFAKVMSPYALTKNNRPWGISVSYNSHIKGGIFARIHLGNSPAVTVAKTLLPYLEGTAKGEQMKNNLRKVGQ